MLSTLISLTRRLLKGRRKRPIAFENNFPEAPDNDTRKLKLVAGRAGPAARVIQVTRALAPWGRLEVRPIGAAGAYSFLIDLARILEAAKAVSGADFVVYQADGGIPLPFTLRLSSGGSVPVCYSVPATTYAQYLNHVVTEYVVRQDASQRERFPDGFELGDQARRICLRLLGDHFLHRRELIPAIACVGIAHDPRAVIRGSAADDVARPVFHDPFLHSSPLADELGHFQWRRKQPPVFYFPLYFFSFAHELGHHADPGLLPGLFESASLSETTILKRLEEFIRNTEADWSKLAGVSSWEPAQQGVLGEVTSELRWKASSWVGEFRSEILADHTAAQLIWRVCVDASVEDGVKQPDIATFFMDAVMSLAFLLVCQTVARAISLDAARNTDMVQGLVALLRYSASTAIRAGTLIDTLALSPEIIGIKVSRKDRKRLVNLADGYGQLAQALVKTSLDTVDHVGRARGVSDKEALHYLELIRPTGFPTSADVEAFWSAVDRMGLWETTDLFRDELAGHKVMRSEFEASRQEAGASPSRHY